MGEGHFTPKNLVHAFCKNPFVCKKNPSKIRKNPFVVKKSRTLFRRNEMPLAHGGPMLIGSYSFSRIDSLAGVVA